MHLALLPQGSIANASTAGEVCAAAPSDYQTYTKVLFVVDKSGSNATTDTNGYRVSTINSFFLKHQANAFVQWGVLVFNGNTSEAYINRGGPQQPTFSNNPTVVSAAIARIGTAPDGDATPYKSALALARSAINYDVTLNADQAANYVIVFLSDGQPTDYGTPIDDVAINADVRSFKEAGKVTVSTVYYGPVDPIASGRLMQMSQIGGGRFLDTNVDGRIPIDYLVGFSSPEPWVIKNFYVTNLNASPCDDGTVGADSDADGLCDVDEMKYNSEFVKDPIKTQRMAGKRFDPYSRNSFSNVFSDSFFYKFVVFGESLPTECTDTSDSDADLLNNCEERFLRSSSPTGPTGIWTSSMQFDADPYNFDSDGDGFTDYFEFVMTRNKSAALDYNNLSFQFLGIRLDTIFFEHRNWRNPVSAIPYDGKFKFSAVNTLGQNCYSYQQSILPLYRTGAVNLSQVGGNSDLVHGADENLILLTLIQSSEHDPNGPGEIKYHFNRTSAAVSQVRLSLDLDRYRSYRVTSQSRVRP